MKTPGLIIVGAGNRGTGYADYIHAHPQAGCVVGVAEPRELPRRALAERHGLPADRIFRSWQELAAQPRLADAVVICTQDAIHAEPAIAFAKLGYDILLEKPLAPNEDDCRRIVAAVREAGVLFGVCHVLRYTPYTQLLKRLLDARLIGDLVSIQHFEPVGYWHMAHSFVRGNWRNEKASSPMLLAKSCHDLDWLSHLVGRRCRHTASFGSLVHFRPECRPTGAAHRCLECPVEQACPYSAKKIYLGMVAKGRSGWPLDVLTPEPTEANVLAALRDGPYGRCVYACDNDVVDHQVVILEFDGGVSASFTMTGFNEGGHRKTRIFGTHGALYGDGITVEHVDFLTDQRTVHDSRSSDGSIVGGHGGGDEGLMAAFLDALARRDPSRILSGAEASLESHAMVFAAERARRTHSVQEIHR